MILVSLVGHDLSMITPIIFEFKYKIERHILVYNSDPARIKKAGFIRNGLKYLKKKYNLKMQTEEIMIDAQNSFLLKELPSKIKSDREDFRDIYLNMGDGPVHVGIMAAFKIVPEGGSILSYSKIKNSYNIIDKEGFSVKKIKHSMGITDYCRLRSINPVRYKNINDLEKRKKDIYELFEKFSRFNKVRVALLKREYNFPYDEYRDILFILKKLKIINKKRKILRAQYLAGGVFEEYIFLLVSSLGFDEVYANVELEYGDDPGEGIANEFDILMIKEKHLHTIECKLVSGLNGKLYI